MTMRKGGENSGMALFLPLLLFFEKLKEL